MNTSEPATFILLHDGTWGVRGKNLAPGEPVVITRADGTSKLGQVGRLRWTSKGGSITIAGLIEVSKGPWHPKRATPINRAKLLELARSDPRYVVEGDGLGDAGPFVIVQRERGLGEIVTGIDCYLNGACFPILRGGRREIRRRYTYREAAKYLDLIKE